jgi:hypothetical protein
MTICNLELKDLTYRFPSREGARKQLRNGRGVLYAMFSKWPSQKSNYYRFINIPAAAHLPSPFCPAGRSQGVNKNQITNNHQKYS